MARTCTVCRHPDRPAIDADLVSGALRRELARRFGLSATSVGRHADAHLPQLMARAAEAEQERGARLLERAERLVTDLEVMAGRAKAGGDSDGFLRVVRELRPTIELLGRATGELAAGGVTVLVAIEQQLGVSLEVARQAVELHRSVVGIDEAAMVETCRKALEARGYRMLSPGSEVATAGCPRDGESVTPPAG